MAAQILANSIIQGFGSLFGGGGGLGSLFGGGGGLGSLFGFASGGFVSGPGTGISDSVFARLSNGEFVLNASAVDHWGSDFLHSLNAKQMPVSLVGAGSTGSSRSGGRQVNVTQVYNISTPDANSFNRTAYQRDQDNAEAIRRNLSR